MKKVIGWALGIIELVLGLILYINQKVEISNNWLYSWTPPYTDYEAKVIFLKWVGILLFLAGLLDFGIMIFRQIHMNNHLQDTSEIMQKRGVTICPGCGIMVATNAGVCPRCGSQLGQIYSVQQPSGQFRQTQDIMQTNQAQTIMQPGQTQSMIHYGQANTMGRFCANCGGAIEPGQVFCPNCGTRVF